MKFAICTVLTLYLVVGARAQETAQLIAQLVDKSLPAAKRSELVSQLSEAPFPDVAPEIVRIVVNHRGLVMYNHTTDKPWTEKRVPPREQVRSSAMTVWKHHVSRSAPGALVDPLVELILGDGTDEERLFFLRALLTRHYTPRAKESLIKIASDHTTSPELALSASTVLIYKDEPNEHLDLVLDACRRFDGAARQAKSLRSATRREVHKRLNSENNQKVVAYGFELLEQLTDGSTGKGYFLAGQLGWFAGVPSVRSGQLPFAPDQRLPEYKAGPNGGLNEQFFQDTVDNALAWWAENHPEN